MSETSPSVLMKARPPSGGFTQHAGVAVEAESRAVSSSRLWLASGSSSRGMNAQPWNSPRTACEAYQPPRVHPEDKGPRLLRDADRPGGGCPGRVAALPRVGSRLRLSFEGT